MGELDKKVLESIAKRGLTPKPYAYFLARRSVFWTLAVLSVVLGAVSVAVAIFALIDAQSAGGRGLDEMPLDDVLVKLPFVWIGSLALLIVSTVFSIRQTRRGYRFRTVHIAGAALLASLLLGGLLHVVGAGEATHAFLRDRFPIYDRLTRSAETRSNDPQGGFLAGRVVRYDGGTGLTLLDFDNHTWTVDIAGASNAMEGSLAESEDVAITGSQTGPSSFRAMSIRDWD